MSQRCACPNLVTSSLSGVCGVIILLNLVSVVWTDCFECCWDMFTYRSVMFRLHYCRFHTGQLGFAQLLPTAVQYPEYINFVHILTTVFSLVFPSTDFFSIFGSIFYPKYPSSRHVVEAPFGGFCCQHAAMGNWWVDFVQSLRHPDCFVLNGDNKVVPHD